VRAELRQDLPATLAGGAEISGPSKAAAVAKAAVTGESTQGPEADGAEPTSEVAKADETPLEQLPATIAWTDTFTSQGQYLLASAFDHVYIQPSGSVPLVGMSSTLPFFKRALDWLGVKVRLVPRACVHLLTPAVSAVRGCAPRAQVVPVAVH